MNILDKLFTLVVRIQSIDFSQACLYSLRKWANQVPIIVCIDKTRGVQQEKKDINYIRNILPKCIIVQKDAVKKLRRFIKSRYIIVMSNEDILIRKIKKKDIFRFTENFESSFCDNYHIKVIGTNRGPYICDMELGDPDGKTNEERLGTDDFFDGSLVSKSSVYSLVDAFMWEPNDLINDHDHPPFLTYTDVGFPEETVLFQMRNYIGVRWEDNMPLISCLTVTRKRVKHLEIAIACWRKQTYPNLELIVVTDDDPETVSYCESLQDARIKIIDVPVGKEKYTLGYLRNISLDHAQGEYVIQWDDDDWYHPTRVEVMYAKLLVENVDACGLGQWLMTWPDIPFCGLSPFSNRGYEGSFLIKRDVIVKNHIRYPDMRRGEDTVFCLHLLKVAKVYVCKDIKYALLYIYNIHGINTWSRNHFYSLMTRGTTIGNVRGIKNEDSKELSTTLFSLVGARETNEDIIFNNVTIFNWLLLGILIILIITFLVTFRFRY